MYFATTVLLHSSSNETNTPPTIVHSVLLHPLSDLFSDHQEEKASVGLLAALLVEASGREHLDCIELLLQKMMKPSPKRNVSEDKSGDVYT